MKVHAKKAGFTLMEIMVVVTIIGIMVLGISQISFPIARYFQQNRMRQQANLQLRGCLATLERVMSGGKASTCVIAANWSQIQFASVDGNSYTITTSNSPPNSVHMLRTSASGGPTVDSVLATHVSQLIFGWEPLDPGLINVTMTLRVPLDSSEGPASYWTVTTPAQVIRMVSM